MHDHRFMCQIRAEAEADEAEILIYDDVGANWFGDGITAKQFVKDLAKVDASLLTVRINSAGGDVFEGLAIHNALQRHDAMVVVEIDALAASIASIIALAGDEVRMADNAFFMVHDPSGLEWGTAEDMRAMAELLDKVGGSLAGVYAEKTGRSVAEVHEWMAAETWFDAEEAAEAGLVDVVTKGKKMAARADLSAFSNIPKALRAAIEGDEPAKADPEPTDDNPSADGGTATDDPPAPAQPAPAAKGDTMSDVKDTAARKTGADAERARQSAIRATVRDHEDIVAVTGETLDAWLDDPEITDEVVKAKLLAKVKADAKDAPEVKATIGAPRADRDPRRGFDGHQDFYLSVIENKKAQNKEDVKDERLRPLAVNDEEGELAFLMPRAFNTPTIRAAAGSDEQGTYAEQYGGFTVPETTLPGLLSVPFEGDPTIGRTQMVPMATPMVKIPARTDKNHSTSVAGGFTVTRRPETIDFTSSRMTTERIALEASSLVGLAFATEEILQDSAVSFAALIDAGFRDQFMSHILDEKIRGEGVGEYEGVLNSNCEVQITKESGQAAATINYKNVVKMRARSWGYGNALWLANHDCLPELAQMSLAVGTGGAPVYVPGTFGGQPDTLLGRPIFYSEYPATLGTVGDLILWNPTQYLEGVYQPLRSAESIHVRFVAHERAFKLWMRNAGACWWRSALTPAQGTNTLSPIVTLATRA